MNSATMHTVQIIKGKTVRVYTITKGLPIATMWTRKGGDVTMALDAAREELATLIAPSGGWKMLPSAL